VLNCGNLSTPHFDFDPPPETTYYKGKFILFARKSQEFSGAIPSYSLIFPAALDYLVKTK
jgi:hypothetical protein